MKRSILTLFVLAALAIGLFGAVAWLTVMSTGDADHPWLVLAMTMAAAAIAGFLVPTAVKLVRAFVTGVVAMGTLLLASNGWVGDDWSEEITLLMVWMVGLSLSIIFSAAVFCALLMQAKWKART